MTTISEKRPRRPVWPLWVYDTFNERGLVHLENSYRYLKDESGLDRAARLSADDIASSIYAELQSTGRTDLLCDDRLPVAPKGISHGG